MRLYLANLCISGTSSASFAMTFVRKETVRNAPNHEFRVQLSESGAFVAKNFEATSFSELVS
jgi:hypothetical protein